MATVTSKWQFSEDEIRAKLEELGYNNVPNSALKEFSDDLHRLISTESSKESLHVGDYSSSTASSFNSSTSTTITSELSTPHEDKPRHKAATQGQSRVPLVHHDEELGYNYQKQLYPIESQAKQPYPPFVRHNTQYVTAEKENQTERRQDTTLRLAQKRKVLRRMNGKAQVFDESFTNDASATDISDVEQRLLDLPLKDENSSINDDQSDGFSAWQQNGKNRNVLPSFIRPRSGDPSSRGIHKTDPVHRYHQFKQEWSSNKVPGERTHKNLRWSTREQMLQYETFEKPRRSYVPNNYVAPTDKKRQALRWEVRSTLANT